jgi:hypothetical protein
MSLVEDYIYKDRLLNPFIWTSEILEDILGLLRMKVKPIKLLSVVWPKALKPGRK